MKMNKFSVFLLAILAAVCFYLFATSLERVPAGEVEVVMEIGLDGAAVTLKPRPLVNTGISAKWFFKQPKIPILGAGYLKERFRLDEQMEFSTSFAYYTIDELTGKRSDKETVSACVIEGRIAEVLDWELFIDRLNPDIYNSDDNPYSIKYRSRAESLAEQIKYLVRAGDPVSLYPGIAVGEQQIQTPVQKIDFWNQELISRRNFIVALKDRYDFRNEEDYTAFLINEHPWYWGLGVLQYESLLNQADEMAEYHQSPYSQGLSVRGYTGRFLNNEDYLLLINMIRRTDNWEQNIMSTEESIRNLEKLNESQYRIMTEERPLAYMLYREYLNDLENRAMKLIDFSLNELNNDFMSYINTEVFERLISAVRKKKLSITMESLADYESTVIDNIILDDNQLENVQRTTDYLKSEYSHYMESDNWEYFSETFSKEVNNFFVENPEIMIPDDEVIQMIYFRLLEYYLEKVERRYSENIVDTSELLKLLYYELIENPEILNSNRTDMAALISNYLTADANSLIISAGEFISQNWNLNYLKEQQRRLTDIKNNVLVPYFTAYMQNEDLTESEALWTAAIKDVLSGEDLSEYNIAFAHDVAEGESLEIIAELYGIDGRDFIRHAHSMIKFADPDDQAVYDFINPFRSVEYIYRRVKRMQLKADELLSFDTIPPYTDDWWENLGVRQKQKEQVIKSFVYPWIDSRLPAAFDKFASESPYIEYFENFFGIRLSDMKLSIERRSVFSNEKSRQIDPDFIGVYKAE